MKKLVLFLAVVAALVLVASCNNEYKSTVTDVEGFSGLQSYTALGEDGTEYVGFMSAAGDTLTKAEFATYEPKPEHRLIFAKYPNEGYLCALISDSGTVVEDSAYVTLVSGSSPYYKISSVRGNNYVYLIDSQKKVGPIEGLILGVDSCIVRYRVDKLYGVMTLDNVDILEGNLADRLYTDKNLIIARYGGKTYKKYDMTGKFLGTKLSSADIDLINSANEKANWKKQ